MYACVSVLNAKKGIGISAAGMYQFTTAKSVQIIRTRKKCRRIF
jgi:hypothetical protein